MNLMKEGGSVPKEARNTCRYTAGESVDVGKAVRDVAKSIPESNHINTGRGFRYFFHKIFQVSSVCVFENDVVRIVIDETTIEGYDEGCWFAI